MLDDNRDIQTLFSRIGQTVVFGQHLTSALHSCCTRVFAAQGFDDQFAHSMMDQQEPEVLRRTWTQLLRLRFFGDDLAVAILGRLSESIDQVEAARKEVQSFRWLVASEQQEGFPGYAALDGFTFSGGKVDFERLILDMVNLATALRKLAEGLETMDGAGMEQVWNVVAAASP